MIGLGRGETSCDNVGSDEIAGVVALLVGATACIGCMTDACGREDWIFAEVCSNGLVPFACSPG